VSIPCDVAIAGGGAIGCALAVALARDGYDVVLLEPKPPPAFDAAAPHDLRTYALSPASIAQLTRLGAWAGVLARRASPYARMQVWADDPTRGIAFDAALVGEPMLGAIVEDRALRDALWQVVLGEPRIATHAASVSSLEADARRVRLGLDDGATIDARLAVAADGGQSRVRALAGLDGATGTVVGGASAPMPHSREAVKSIGAEAPPTTGGEAQRAIVANVRTTRPHEATAWQRFTPDGPLAFLPLSNGESSIVWSVREARARDLLALDDGAFARELGAAFQHRLGEISSVSARASFPLVPMHAPRYVADRVALVGDAAHVVLPLAGQGLNLGLLDSAALADVLREARDDPGDAAALGRYARWRRADNALAGNAFVALDRLFRAEAPGVAWLRAAGLALADRIAPLKREFALQASGFAGRVPTLSRRLA
jgi:2-polyprenyl-6-methoxyphenol hydroxylase-like FAD-dependent oxidoreductase